MGIEKSFARGSALAIGAVLALALHSGTVHARAEALVDAPQVVFTSAYVPTQAQVRDRIILAGQSLGWAVTREAPGTLELQYDKNGKHMAAIVVRYDHTGYKIDYLNSYNLNYAEAGDGRRIHPNYNRWIRNLMQRISVGA
ncbi:hypothetical protein [Acidovorax sp. A1169]|uniref:hypothetical protein n=1 Tax=Acidovorax sp. A1169 TaxID=3059524 RepID=UPI002737C808|nr:hypothetical protein [Acidovorax sp. A1169]MDP4076786.1 hypothetical protein [Acidovorax sp. A1169]